MRRIAAFVLPLLLAAAPPLLAALAPKTHAERLLARYYRAGEPGAVALVEQNGKVVLRTAIGVADLELGTPLRPEHLLKVGSISKQFTAVAILQLVGDQKLALADPIATFFPDLPAPLRAITIEQLLTHTSGLPDYTGIPEYAERIRLDIAPSDLVSLIAKQPLAFAPGTRFQYTNSGYFLLGAIVEMVSGQSFGDYLRTKILEPHGLTQTKYDSLAEIIRGRARGYVQDPKGGFANAPLYSPTRALSVGNLLATVDDLRRWNHLLLDGKVLPREMLDRAWTAAKLPDGKSTGYGFGWFLGDLEAARVIEHGGDIPGFSAHVLSMPEKQLFVAVLTNDASHEPRPDYVATQLATIFLGHPYDPVAVSVPAAELDRVAGTYRNAAGVVRTVTREGGHITVQRGAGRKTEAFPLGNGRFFYRNAFVTVRFEGDELVLENKGVALDRAKKESSVP